MEVVPAPLAFRDTHSKGSSDVTFQKLDDVIEHEKAVIRQEISSEYDKLLKVRLSEEKIIMTRKLREEIDYELRAEYSAALKQ